MLTKLDANQVIRTVYSEADEAFKMVPSSATSFQIELDADDGDTIGVQLVAQDTATVFNAIDAANDATSAAIDILNYKGYAVAVEWSDLTGVLDGTVKIQHSLDDILYFDVGSGSVTLSATPGSAAFNISDAYYKYIRLVYTKNQITGGSITAKVCVKA